MEKKISQFAIEGIIDIKIDIFERIKEELIQEKEPSIAIKEENKLGVEMIEEDKGERAKQGRNVMDKDGSEVKESKEKNAN